MLIMLFNSQNINLYTTIFCVKTYIQIHHVLVYFLMSSLALSRDNKGNYFKMLKRNSLLKIVIKWNLWGFFYFKCIRIVNKASGILRIMNVNTVNIHITNDFKNNHSVNPLKRLSLNCIHIERSLFAKENHIYDFLKYYLKNKLVTICGKKFIEARKKYV